MTSAGLFWLVRIDVLLHVGLVDIVFIENFETRALERGNLLAANDVGGVLDAVVAYFVRALCNRDIDQAALDLLVDAWHRIEYDHLDDALFARRLDALGRAAAGEGVGAEHAGEIRIARQYRSYVSSGLVGVVLVVQRLQHGDVRVLF